MFARVMRFVLGPDTEWEAQHMAAAISRIVEQQPGFCGIQFFHDYENGDYQWITYWATEEDWHRSYSNLIDAKRAMIGDRYLWDIAVQMYEVYTPKVHEEKD